MDGFVSLFRKLFIDAGISKDSIHIRSKLQLPGFFNAEKCWDFLVMDRGQLVAILELKFHVGSFANNINNRIEEAVGSSYDLWTAFRAGAFPLPFRPWLGYLMLVEDCPRSRKPVVCQEPHFPVLPAYREKSYVERYGVLIQRLVRERLYNSGCLLASERTTGVDGVWREPNPEFGFQQFVASLRGRIASHLSGRER